MVSDLKRKNSAHSAMSELLSKSNAVSTGKNESEKQRGSGGRIYMQAEKNPRGNRQAAPTEQHRRSVQRSTDNLRKYPKAAMRPQQSVRTAAKANSFVRADAPAKAGRRAAKTSFKVAHAVVTTAILLCICTGIISAVLILNPGEENGVAVDTTIGVPAAVTMPQERALLQDDLTETENISEPDGRYTVTFTFYDRESLVCTSDQRTIGELAELMEIQFSDVQRENVDAEAIIQSDTTVAVDAVTYDTVAVNAPIPYETRYVDVQTIPKGTTQTHQKGVNGTLTTEYQVTYVNGTEVERVQTNEYTSVAPTENVVYRGVGGTLTVGGKTYSYSYYLDCKSTVYTGGGTTASGLPATEKVIAVDPKVIPLGTTCYISGSYREVGFRTAADTGGGIKGNTIDIYYETGNPAMTGYGWRNVRVYIFN